MADDAHAHRAYPTGAYASIPKSVFALLAYHLAERLAGEEEAVATLRQEATALRLNGQITESQYRAVIKALPTA